MVPSKIFPAKVSSTRVSIVPPLVSTPSRVSLVYGAVPCHMACLITVKAGPIASCLIRELMVLLVEMRILRLWKAKGTHWERHKHGGYRGERLYLH